MLRNNSASTRHKNCYFLGSPGGLGSGLGVLGVFCIQVSNQHWLSLIENSGGPYSPFRALNGEANISRDCSSAAVSKAGLATVTCAIGASTSLHCRKPPGAVQGLVRLLLTLVFSYICLKSLVAKVTLNILNSLARFLTKTIGSLFLIIEATSRICTTSYFATKSTGTSVKKSQERKSTL